MKYVLEIETESKIDILTKDIILKRLRDLMMNVLGVKAEIKLVE